MGQFVKCKARLYYHMVAKNGGYWAENKQLLGGGWCIKHLPVVWFECFSQSSEMAASCESLGLESSVAKCR